VPFARPRTMRGDRGGAVPQQWAAQPGARGCGLCAGMGGAYPHSLWIKSGAGCLFLGQRAGALRTDNRERMWEWAAQ